MQLYLGQMRYWLRRKNRVLLLYKKEGHTTGYVLLFIIDCFNGLVIQYRHQELCTD